MDSEKVFSCSEPWCVKSGSKSWLDISISHRCLQLSLSKIHLLSITPSLPLPQALPPQQTLPQFPRLLQPHLRTRPAFSCGLTPHKQPFIKSCHMALLCPSELTPVTTGRTMQSIVLVSCPSLNHVTPLLKILQQLPIAHVTKPKLT